MKLKYSFDIILCVTSEYTENQHDLNKHVFCTQISYLKRFFCSL